METKHTKGEWAWQKFGNYYLLTAQHGMREIILAAYQNNDYAYPTMNDDGILKPVDSNHPNAKLIAAAPISYEQNIRNLVFLRSIKGMLGVTHQTILYNECDIRIKETELAIKKATE
jgi:hypothetical protein